MTFRNFCLPTSLQRPPSHILSIFFPADNLPRFQPTDDLLRFPPTDVLTTTSCPRHFAFFYYRRPSMISAYRRPSEISAYRGPYNELLPTILRFFFPAEFPPTDVFVRFPPTDVLTTTSCPRSSFYFFLPTTFRNFRLPMFF